MKGILRRDRPVAERDGRGTKGRRLSNGCHGLLQSERVLFQRDNRRSELPNPVRHAASQQATVLAVSKTRILRSSVPVLGASVVSAAASKETKQTRQTPFQNAAAGRNAPDRISTVESRCRALTFFRISTAKLAETETRKHRLQHAGSTVFPELQDLFKNAVASSAMQQILVIRTTSNQTFSKALRGRGGRQILGDGIRRLPFDDTLIT